MRSARTASLSLVALLVLCTGLAAWLDVWFQSWQGNRTQSTDLLAVVLGDARRMFANHFFVKADAYFHSGYYPSIFDSRRAVGTPHVAADTGTVGGKQDEHEGHGHEGHDDHEDAAFLDAPRDWIDAFSRNFFPSRHTHLDHGGAGEKGEDLADSSEVREILPWLKLSAELNPNDIRVYTTAAYWLRDRMGKAAEAESFLRDGLRANPGSYEILYELGRVYKDNHHDPVRAGNLWEAALNRWNKQEAAKPDPDTFLYIQITSHLSLLREEQGDYAGALEYMKLWKSRSPQSAEVQKRIDELQEKMASGKIAPSTNSVNDGHGH